MNKQIKAHLSLLGVALIYGANYTIAKSVLDDGYIQPFTLVLFRALSGVLLFSLFHALFIREKVARKDYLHLLLCSVFGIAVNQMFFLGGLKLTTPINASLIMTTTPILVLVASAILLKEKITIRKIIGIAIGVMGAILLISYGKEIRFSSDQLLGDIMIFINATSYGIYLVLVKSLIEKYHPITIVKWVFTFGLLLVFPFGVGDLGAIEWATFSTVVWGAFIYVLLCTTFLAYLLNAYALSIVNPSVVSIYIYLQPLIASVVALLLQVDVLTPVKIISGILIFIGVYLVSTNGSFWQKRKKKHSIRKINI